MSIFVGLGTTPEGRAAHDAAIEEARLRGTGVVLLESAGADEAKMAAFAEIAGQARAARVELKRRVLEPGIDLGDELISASHQPGAHVVIGLKRRSPVGGLLMGSTSQRVLLEAGCPVHAVTVPAGPRQ